MKNVSQRSILAVILCLTVLFASQSFASNIHPWPSKYVVNPNVPKNSQKQLNPNDVVSASADALKVSSPIVSLTAGAYHTCALRDDHTISCWGNNEHGQLGTGDNQDAHKPRTVSDIDNAVQVSAGGYHTCATTSDGQVYCWGDNENGQVGDGTKLHRYNPTLVKGLDNIKKVSAGGYHTCAINNLGKIFCWGKNKKGQLGQGPDTIVDEVSPQALVGVVDYVEPGVDVEAGTDFTCYIKNSGHVACWGDNFNGKAGVGAVIQIYPKEIENLNEVKTLSLGDNHVCAINSVEASWCWGDNYDGQLGNGEHNNHTSDPVVVSSYFTDYLGIAAAKARFEASASELWGQTYTCALRKNQQGKGWVYCWGDPDQLGIGFGTEDQWTSEALQQIGQANWNPRIPMRIFGLPDHVIQIVAGAHHTCALADDGKYVCWGLNNHGQLGIGTTNSKAAP